MASTVITAPELHEYDEDRLRSKLFEFVPLFRKHMDRGAGDLIGDLESIIEHRLWERVGYDSLESYAREYLHHSEQWCHDIIRVYRHDWSPEQRAKRSIGDLVAEVEPAKTLSEAMIGNSNASKGNASKWKGNSDSVSTAVLSNTKKPKRDNAYWIARLKRDAETDPKAAALLGRIEDGEIRPYRAAREMGWVKPPDPARIVEQQREKLEPEDQVRVWEQWGRALPEGSVDRLAIAQEAFINLDPREQDAFMRWARKCIKRVA